MNDSQFINITGGLQERNTDCSNKLVLKSTNE